MNFMINFIKIKTFWFTLHIIIIFFIEVISNISSNALNLFRLEFIKNCLFMHLKAFRPIENSSWVDKITTIIWNLKYGAWIIFHWDLTLITNSFLLFTDVWQENSQLVSLCLFHHWGHHAFLFIIIIVWLLMFWVRISKYFLIEGKLIC